VDARYCPYSSRWIRRRWSQGSHQGATRLFGLLTVSVHATTQNVSPRYRPTPGCRQHQGSRNSRIRLASVLCDAARVRPKPTRGETLMPSMSKRNFRSTSAAPPPLRWPWHLRAPSCSRLPPGPCTPFEQSRSAIRKSRGLLCGCHRLLRWPHCRIGVRHRC